MFKDVPDNHWSSQYVQAAVAAGIVVP
ncbi:S-layer homology domain-containing protein [Brevibacillus daliensis]